MNVNEIFETMPVRRAILRQIAPAIISQMIVLVYNLADTYFVGMLNSPVQTAAVTIGYPSFLMLTAVSNLLGVGGASCLSRALGVKDEGRARAISSVSFWFGILASLLYSLMFLAFARPILELCGAGETTYQPSFGYAKWVIVIGGIGVIMNTLLANLVRAEGSSARASFGMSLGGLLNIALDPLFVLPQFLDMGAEGAGIATAISNAAASLYFIRYIASGRSLSLTFAPSYLKRSGELLKPILRIGFPSALQYGLTVVAVAAQALFVSKYDTEAVAALGIAKKIDQLPLYFSIGTASGLMPFLAYNHAAGNIERQRSGFRFGVGIAVGFALLCLVVFEIFAPQLTALFIEDAKTVAYGAAFLRCMVTAMPLMAVCYSMIIQFQAMGMARPALICSVLRKGVLDVPLLFALDAIFPLYGCMCVQPIVDTISLAAALRLHMAIRNER